jgi:hypothetical protein
MIASLALLLAGCPALAPAPAGEGTTTVVHAPAPAAMALNNEGKVLYRQGRWREAREKYQAALAADPSGWRPALNAACAQARQERFVRAADGGRGAGPPRLRPLGTGDAGGGRSGRPARAAADEALRAAVAEAVAAWGRSLCRGLFFVARTRPAVKLGGRGCWCWASTRSCSPGCPPAGAIARSPPTTAGAGGGARAQDGRTVVYVRVGQAGARRPGAPGLRGSARAAARS